MIDFKKIKTYCIFKRKHKVFVKDFLKLEDSKKIKFKNKNLEELARSIIRAKENGCAIILMMGAHSIKVGLSPFIIELMKKGFINHLAMNGATSIHDFEIAMIGKTSEDVAVTIKDGKFGMVEETGKLMNEAINKGYKKRIGYGTLIAKQISSKNFKYKEKSIIYNAYKLKIPITVHVAIGTDTIHQHPSCRGEAIGFTTYQDFKILVDSLCSAEGGVIINLGSAVIMPEVFLKALSIARNLGAKLNNITTASLDMIDHYRPRVNVIGRPVLAGGKGLFILGPHQKTIPTLYKLIINHA